MFNHSQVTINSPQATATHLSSFHHIFTTLPLYRPWSGQCRTWEVRCRTWEVRCRTWEVRCRVWETRRTDVVNYSWRSREWDTRRTDATDHKRDFVDNNMDFAINSMSGLVVCSRIRAASSSPRPRDGREVRGGVEDCSHFGCWVQQAPTSCSTSSAPRPLPR